MDKKLLENMLKNENQQNEQENLVLHQTTEDVISDFDCISQNNLNISAIEDKDFNDKKETEKKESFADKISEKLSSVGRALKMEKTGMMYCLIAHFYGQIIVYI